MNFTEDEEERIAIQIYDGGLSEAEAVKLAQSVREWSEREERIKEKARLQKMKKHFNSSRKMAAAGERDD